MSKSEQPSVPGLAVWIALLVAFACIIAFIFKLPSKDRLEKKEMSAWLNEKSLSQKDSRLILALGTSLTGCGLDSASHLEAAIKRSSGKNVQVLKVWKLNCGPPAFADISPALKQLHPAVVGIEANILFYAFEKDKGWPAYVQRFRDFVGRRRYRYEPDSKPLVVKRKISELAIFRTGLMDTAQLTGFAELLRYWQKKGTRIFLLNFPLQAGLESRKWNGPDTAAFFNNINYLKRYCAVEYINPGMLLDESYFIDHAHMNERGRAVQTGLFCRTVTEQLNKP